MELTQLWNDIETLTESLKAPLSNVSNSMQVLCLLLLEAVISWCSPCQPAMAMNSRADLLSLLS